MISVKKADKKKFDLCTKSMDWPLKKISTVWPLLKLQVFGLKMIVFYLKYPKTIFSDIISVKKKGWEKVRILDKIPGLTTLKNVHFFALVKKFNFLVLKWLFSI